MADAQAVTITITILLAITGWIAVHFLSASRDRKKEWREFSRDTASYIASIEKESIEYHTYNVRNVEHESKIKNDIDILDIRISIIKKNLSFLYDVSFFRAAITLHNFETKNFITQNIYSEIVQDISRHANMLIKALYEAE